MPAGHRRPAGRHLAASVGAQRCSGQPGQYRNARPERTPAFAGTGRSPGPAGAALLHGRLPVQQWFRPLGPGAQGQRERRPARRIDPRGPRQSGGQSRNHRAVRGLPSQRTGSSGQSVRRSGKRRQQRQRALLAVLVAAQPRHPGTGGDARIDAGRRHPGQQRHSRKSPCTWAASCSSRSSSPAR